MYFSIKQGGSVPEGEPTIEPKEENVAEKRWEGRKYWIDWWWKKQRDSYVPTNNEVIKEGFPSGWTS